MTATTDAQEVYEENLRLQRQLEELNAIVKLLEEQNADLQAEMDDLKGDWAGARQERNDLQGQVDRLKAVLGEIADTARGVIR